MSKRDDIKTAIGGLFACFHRATPLTEEALGMWVFVLEQYPLKDVRKAVYAWASTHKWPPDSLDDFRRIVAGDMPKAEEPELPGEKEFLEDYRKQKLGRGPNPPPPDNSSEPRTPSHEARVHWSIIKDISAGVISCPKHIANHNVYEPGDAEERWYWAEFRKRLS